MCIAGEKRSIFTQLRLNAYDLTMRMIAYSWYEPCQYHIIWRSFIICTLFAEYHQRAWLIALLVAKISNLFLLGLAHYKNATCISFMLMHSRTLLLDDLKRAPASIAVANGTSGDGEITLTATWDSPRHFRDPAVNPPMLDEGSPAIVQPMVVH